MKKPYRMQATNPVSGVMEICKVYPDYFFGKKGERDAVHFPGEEKNPFNPAKAINAKDLKDLQEVVEVGDLAEDKVNVLKLPVHDEVFRAIKKRQRFSVEVPICPYWDHLRTSADGKKRFSHVEVVVMFSRIKEIEKRMMFELKKINRAQAKNVFESTNSKDAYRILLGKRVDKNG